MAILTTSGRAAIAAAIKSQTLHFAWGRGGADWDNNRPPEPRSAIALIHEVGRRKVNLVQYCKPQSDGTIIMLGARYAPSDTPTNNLYLRTDFDFNDALGETIRELGVFVGTELRAGLPAGQRYFAPSDLQSPGILLAIDYITPIQRGVGALQTFDFVITF